MPHAGRPWQFGAMLTIADFKPLSPAEEKLVSEASRPNRVSLGDGTLPTDQTPDNTIRAELLRHVLLSGDGVHLDEKGLRLRGACIVGQLDLQGCSLDRDITLSHCRLEQPVTVVNARLRGLHISGVEMAGLTADNAWFSGSLYIRAGTVVAGEISLAGARIAGDLQLCDAEVRTSAQDAVFAASLRVEGSVYLGNYPLSNGVSTLVASGTLFFSSARVEHDFFVTNTAISLSGEVVGDAVFDATEEHGRDIALSLARAHVGGILYFQDNQITGGIVNLAGADVARLKDEPVGPGANYPIRLDGFRYSDFSRHADTSVAARLNWLERRPAGTPFTAQPYEQLATVFTALGHRTDARTVLMHKERLLRSENRRMLAEGRNGIRWALSAATDPVLRLTIGYGYRPARAVMLAVVLVLALGFFFDKAWRVGDMTPNAAPILVSAPWIAATESHPENPGGFWSEPGQAGQDWETFNAFAYAADLVIPIVSLGQEDAWAPSTSRSPWGRAGWWLRWFAKALGWIVTALGAAAITGVIRKD